MSRSCFNFLVRSLRCCGCIAGVFGASAVWGVTLDQIVNGIGKWKDPLNWTGGIVPTNAEIVVGKKVTLDLGDAFSVNTLKINGNGIDGAGLLSLVGPGSTWQSGNLVGVGGIGQLVITSTGNLEIFGGQKSLSNWSFINEGLVTWTGGDINSGNGATILNRSGATIRTTTDGSLLYNLGGTRTLFTNAGTFSKTGGTGTTDIQATFNNTGSVSVSSGTLQLSGGGTSSNTVTLSAAAARLRLASLNFEFTNGSILNGPGAVEIASAITTFSGNITGSANLVISGGTARVTGQTSLTGGGTFSGGTLDGTGTLTFGAPLTLSGTTLAGTGTLTANGGATLTGSFYFKNGQTLTLAGTSTWSAGTIYHGTGAILNNTGTLTNTHDGSLHHSFGGTALTFNNSGTFTKSTATGTTDLDALLTNTGTLNVQAGTLNLLGGGTSSGPIAVSSSATLLVSNGLSVSDAAQLTGAGSLRLTGGTLTLSGRLAIDTFTIEGGHLAGSQTFAETVNWHGGDWDAAAPGSVTTIGSGATLTLANGGYKDFNRRAIVVAADGTVIWQSGYLRGGNGSTFTNHGTFLDQNSSGYSIKNPGDASGFGGTFSFINHATYTRDIAGITYFDVPFENHGTLNLRAGDIQLRDGGAMSATSIVNASSGTHLYFTDDYTLADGAKLQGAGTFIHSGGTLSIDGTLTASNFHWSGGDWNATAAALTSIASGTTLTLDNGGDKNFNRRSITIDDGGIVNWESGYLRGGNGSVLTNNGTFHDANASSYAVVSAGSSGHGGTFGFVNNGLYLRDVGGTTSFTAPFDNHGTVTLASGEIHLDGGGIMSSTSVVNAAANTRFIFSDSYTIAGGARFTGAGAFIHTDGTLDIDGALHASSFHWSGGNWNALIPGTTTTIASGTTLTIDGGGNKDFNRRTLAIADGGTLNWQSGYLRSGNGGAIVNAGTFNDQNASSYDIENPGTASGFGGTFTFTNSGVYNKTTSGTTRIEVPFTNSGTLNLAAGTIEFTSTFANTGTIQLAANASAYFPSTLTFGPSSLLGGTGTINAPSVEAAGEVGPGNSPGKLTLTGDLSLLATSSLLIELGGATQGSEYDYLSVGGTATLLGGSLEVVFLNGYQWQLPEDATFTILTANAGLTGAFANVANGGRLATFDGAATFQVNYGFGNGLAANSIVLSNFVVAVPEPSTYAMMGVGALVVFWSLRRRRR